MALNIRVTETVETHLRPETIERRVMDWALRGSFKLTDQGSSSWTFTRGHWIHPVYSFNIRKYPTKLFVQADGSTVHCLLRCESRLGSATKHDPERLRDELRALADELTL